KRDLHVNPVGVIDVQTVIGIVSDTRTMLGQITRGRLLGETGYPDREVIDNCGGALTVERDQRPVITEANNSERLILADHRETEHFLIEIDGTLEIRNLNADVVDVRGLEIDLVRRGGGRSPSRPHRGPGNQFA